MQLTEDEIDVLFAALLELRVSSKDRKEVVKQLDDIPDREASYLKMDRKENKAERVREKLHQAKGDWKSQ